MGNPLVNILKNFKSDIPKYIKKPIIFDTGPLLLYFAALYDPDSIGKNKITKAYTKDEVNLLLNFAALFTEIIVTPEVLAEFSNLAKRDLKKEYFQYFMTYLITDFKKISEEYIEKDEILNNLAFPRVGFADISLIELSRKNKYLIFTKEVELELLCETHQLPVIHFDKMRVLVW